MISVQWKNSTRGSVPKRHAVKSKARILYDPLKGDPDSGYLESYQTTSILIELLQDYRTPEPNRTAPNRIELPEPYRTVSSRIELPRAVSNTSSRIELPRAVSNYHEP